MIRAVSRSVFAAATTASACVLCLGSPPLSSTALAAPDPEPELASRAPLATVLALALERNPELAESGARARAAEARRAAAPRLPEPQLKYEQWGVPLSRPYALDRADTLMLGLRQVFPAWGSLDARARAAEAEAGGAEDATRTRRQEIAARVRRAYAEYYRADRELGLHREHVELMARALELARLNQRTGHGGLPDVLRMELELTRLHADVARIEREQRSSRAQLNVLMNRSPDAPLGPPEDLAAPAPAADVASLERGLDASRPEIDAAARAVHRSEAMLEGTRRAARFPELMVGLDYWYMPMGVETHHGYGAMLAINLPWLSGRRRDEEREAAEMVRADQHALDAARNTVRFELRDAAARVDSARRTFAIVDQDLLTRARRSLEATQAAYAAGQGDAAVLLDALRAYLQVRIERVQALAELAASQADLQRAAGIAEVSP